MDRLKFPYPPLLTMYPHYPLLAFLPPLLFETEETEGMKSGKTDDRGRPRTAGRNATVDPVKSWKRMKGQGEWGGDLGNPSLIPMSTATPRVHRKATGKKGREGLSHHLEKDIRS